MNFKHLLLGTAAAVSMAALSQNNAAQAGNHGWYVSIEGGANWVNKNNGRLTFADADMFDPASGDAFALAVHDRFNTGWAVLGS